MGISCFLGLTATATRSSALDVARHLGVAEESILRGPGTIPANLHLSVSSDRDPEQVSTHARAEQRPCLPTARAQPRSLQALVTLLQSDRFRALDSVIVYCNRREDTERVAALLRTCLREAQAPGSRGEVEAGLHSTDGPRAHARPDHHGSSLQAEPRRLWLKPTMPAWAAGSGGGCNGPSWRAGCGWWWPRWPSGWGWTGQTCGPCCTWGCPQALRATCRLWAGLGVMGSLHSATSSSGPRWVPVPPPLPQPRPLLRPLIHAALLQGEDLWELRRHVHANVIDFLAVKRLVQRVFPPCACARQPPEQQGDESQEEHSARVLVATSPQDADHPSLEHTTRCPGHKRALPVQPTVQALDLPEEGEEQGAWGGGHPSTPASSEPCSAPSHRDSAVLP